MNGGARVVVTGIGAVTPAGHTVAATADAVRRGTPVFAPPTLFDAGAFADARAAEVRGFDAAPYFRQPKAMKLAHRTTRFAVAAAAMALASGGWTDDMSRETMGVLLGTSGSDPQVGALASALAGDTTGASVTDIPAFAGRVLDRLNPLWLLIGLPNMPSSHVAIQLDARGPNSTLMTDWIAGLQAVGEGAQWIAAGEATAVLAGGTDTALHPHAYGAFQQAGLLRDRPGPHPPFVPGEGAAVLLLEERGQAMARGAAILAEVLSFASGVSLSETVRTVRSTTDRQGARVAAVIGRAADEGVGPVDAPAAPCFEFTSRIGHALAAAGAIDAALGIALLSKDPGGVLLCNSVGFGGQAATLALAMAPAGAQA